MDFNAEICLMEHDGVSWKEERLRINSKDSIRKLFGKYKNNVTQVDLTKHFKVYYSIDTLENVGYVQATVEDFKDDKHYMASPILLVECDDEKPINISEDGLKFMKESISFF